MTQPVGANVAEIYRLLFGHLDNNQVAQIAEILSKTKEPVLNQSIKSSVGEETPAPVEKIDLFDFHEMKLNKDRSLTERQDPKWRRSCEYWCTKFQDMGQPLEIYWSVKDEPRATTCFIRDVKAERVEINKAAGESTGERTILYYKIWGMSIPAEFLRKKAKRAMSEIWSVPVSDSEEFISFRAELQNQSLGLPQDNKQDAEDLSKEEVGARFERQLEWRLNMEGYHVDLHGRMKKKRDDGVDLILVKNGMTTLVQAKAISKKKKLSPAEIDIIASELRGFYQKNKDKSSLIVGQLARVMLIVSHAESLPEETRKHAEEINLSCKVVPYQDVWPEIKCVITTGGRKVYYSHKDSHYNTTKMLVDKRRFWASSKANAEALGFSPAKPSSVKRKGSNI